MVDDPSGYVDVLLSDTKKRRAAERGFKKRLAGYAAKPVLADDDAIPEPALTLEEVIAELERDRLFAILEDLVLWENTTSEAVLQQARDEIWQSWRSLADGSPLSFAALWERWDKGGDFLVSFTIVTTAASPGLVDIHHRQPAIIDPDRFDDWLNPTSPTPRLLDMVREPYGGPYDNSLHESL